MVKGPPWIQYSMVNPLQNLPRRLLTAKDKTRMQPPFKREKERSRRLTGCLFNYSRRLVKRQRPSTISTRYSRRQDQLWRSKSRATIFYRINTSTDDEDCSRKHCHENFYTCHGDPQEDNKQGSWRNFTDAKKIPCIVDVADRRAAKIEFDQPRRPRENYIIENDDKATEEEDSRSFPDDTSTTSSSLSYRETAQSTGYHRQQETGRWPKKWSTRNTNLLRPQRHSTSGNCTAIAPT